MGKSNIAVTIGLNALELLRLRGAKFNSIDMDGDCYMLSGIIGQGDFNLPVAKSVAVEFLAKTVELETSKRRKGTNSRSKTKNPRVKIESPAVAKFSVPQRILSYKAGVKMSGEDAKLMRHFKDNQPVAKGRRNKEELRELEVARSYILSGRLEDVRLWVESWNPIH